ncbi:Protein of unknown function [Gryllus bimaculatus]|nr:Protein of unknown function [Gryllus bimaculatus]
MPPRLRQESRTRNAKHGGNISTMSVTDESHTEGPGAPSKDEGEWKKNLTTRALLRDTLSQLKVVRRTSSQILQGSMSTRPGLGDDSHDTKEEPEEMALKKALVVPLKLMEKISMDYNIFMDVSAFSQA